jgi:hypothetical protein
VKKESGKKGAKRYGSMEKPEIKKRASVEPTSQGNKF